ncbi:hypothetical protein ABW19_dt0209866 [Dactylella cylindrospora]|nr:hypothetical protein ABW19_dt0209866 [Dactylella cylindrospora]
MNTSKHLVISGRAVSYYPQYNQSLFIDADCPCVTFLEGFDYEFYGSSPFDCLYTDTKDQVRSVFNIYVRFRAPLVRLISHDMISTDGEECGIFRPSTWLAES